MILISERGCIRGFCRPNRGYKVPKERVRKPHLFKLEFTFLLNRLPVGEHDWIMIKSLPSQVGENWISEDIEPGLIVKHPIRPSYNKFPPLPIIRPSERIVIEANISKARRRDEIAEITGRG